MRETTRGRAGRRLAVFVTAAAALPVVALAPTPAQAAAAVTCASTGPTYAVDTAGNLLRQAMPTPLTGGTMPSPSTIDTGWSGYGQVMAGPDQELYGVKSDGLYLSRRTGSGTWDIHHKKISNNFGQYQQAADRDKITVDRAGHIWRLDENGALRWHKYYADTSSWYPGGDKIVDAEWSRYDAIVAGDEGVIYGREAATGSLYRSRYDFTSQRWTERHIRVSYSGWNTEGDLASLGGDTLLRVMPDGNLRYYRYDEDTDAWAVAAKVIGSDRWAGYRNVTAAPDTCSITADHTPPAPQITVEAHSTTSVLQASAGTVEYAYTDGIGRLVHGRQSDPSDFNSVQWTVVDDQEGFTGRPSLAEHSDGRLVLTAHNLNSDIWTRDQAAPAGADWSNWTDLAGRMAQHATTAELPDGRLVQFSVDADGRPWYRAEQEADGYFMSWLPLSGGSHTRPLTAVTVRDGIQLFGVNASGTLTTAHFSDGTLSAWTNLAGTGFTGTPAVVVYPGYRLAVFARDADGHIVHLAQSSEGAAFPGTWSQVGDKTFAGSPSVVISPLTGITEIMARADDGYLYNTGEQTQGSGTWRTWKQETYEAAATDPTAFTYTNASGPTWAFSYRTGTNQTRVYEASSATAFAAARTTAATAPPAPVFTAHALPAPTDEQSRP
ncbi:hypothetical protein SUDANB145_04378 [Streptomyces sp. enrichment culture]|uniref:tachylectin-related carbohydrate-binding protein n=1 Tax=Streptomyces sp. enrichment culture TaxID=1795815 RepID=UPI003F55B89D